MKPQRKLKQIILELEELSEQRINDEATTTIENAIEILGNLNIYSTDL